MINTREIAEKYRLSHWARIMRERVESGLSIKEYCKQIGICGNTYFYWQRRVRAAACEQLALSVPENRNERNRQTVLHLTIGLELLYTVSGSGVSKSHRERWL